MHPLTRSEGSHPANRTQAPVIAPAIRRRAGAPMEAACRRPRPCYIGTMVPSNTDTSDTALRTRLEDLSLPPSSFSHREHLRVAWSYLAEGDDFGLAAARFRDTLRRYTVAI